MNGFFAKKKFKLLKVLVNHNPVPCTQRQDSTNDEVV
jgi:hypothetical protein